ncbi:MAG: hypothetical protein V9G22_09590 [Ottowia sp.]
MVQIKKNFDEYVSGDWLNKPITIEAKNIYIPKEVAKKELPKIEIKPKTNIPTKSNSINPPIF